MTSSKRARLESRSVRFASPRRKLQRRLLQCGQGRRSLRSHRSNDAAVATSPGNPAIWSRHAPAAELIATMTMTTTMRMPRTRDGIRRWPIVRRVRWQSEGREWSKRKSGPAAKTPAFIRVAPVLVRVPPNAPVKHDLAVRQPGRVLGSRVVRPDLGQVPESEGRVVRSIRAAKAERIPLSNADRDAPQVPARRRVVLARRRSSRRGLRQARRVPTGNLQASGTTVGDAAGICRAPSIADSIVPSDSLFQTTLPSRPMTQ